MSDCNKLLCEHVVLPIFFFILTDERNLSKLSQKYLTFYWLGGYGGGGGGPTDDIILMP